MDERREEEEEGKKRRRRWTEGEELRGPANLGLENEQDTPV
jgi:hypothetical protein